MVSDDRKSYTRDNNKEFSNKTWNKIGRYSSMSRRIYDIRGRMV